MHPLAVEELTKRYGRTAALDGLSFAVPEGSVCGFLGPNGAGKTTTLRILFGLALADVRPRAGDRADRAACSTATASIPAAPPTTSWRWRPHGPGAAIADEALERAGLTAVADRRIGACSYGTRRRLALAAALLARARDPAARRARHGPRPACAARAPPQLREHAAAGGTVLLSSHVLEEVAATCDRVVVVNRGRRVAEGGLDDLLAQRIRLRSPEPERRSGRSEPAGRQARTGRGP